MSPVEDSKPREPERQRRGSRGRTEGWELQRKPLSGEQKDRFMGERWMDDGWRNGQWVDGWTQWQEFVLWGAPALGSAPYSPVLYAPYIKSAMGVGGRWRWRVLDGWMDR